MVTACGHHVHQSIDAEQLDLASNEVADPGLSDTEEPRRSRLSEAPLIDDRSDDSHESGTNLEVLSLLFGKSQILEDVASRASDTCIHFTSCSHC